MDNNELNRVSELIWSKLNTIENKDKSREEQIELIKPIILRATSESRQVGRRQILNYLEEEIKTLRK